MPIDTSIYGNQVQPKFNTPFETLGQLGQLQQQQAQASAARALEEERRQKIAETQRSQQSDELLGQLFKQHTKQNPTTGQVDTDHQAIYNGLMQVDPAKAQTYLNLASTAETHFRQATKDQLEYQKKLLDFQNGLAQTVKDLPPEERANGWAINRMAFGQMFPQAIDQIPAEYPGDKALDTMIVKGQSLSEQIANHFKVAETEEKKALAEKARRPEKVDLEAAEQALLTKKNLGMPLTAEETASLKAYQDRKRTVSDPAAVAASERATAAQNATNARLDKSELFARQEVGRKELTDKVEPPYNDAVEKANVLRSVIAAARGGNMEAASVQSLLGTLGLVTTEGVKRITNVELGTTADAGSLLERIKGQASKVTSGNPLSPKLQQDLEDLATLLQRSARQKYEQAHRQVKTRYGLTDEVPMPDPLGSTTDTSGPAGVVTYADYLKSRKKPK